MSVNPKLLIYPSPPISLVIVCLFSISCTCLLIFFVFLSFYWYSWFTMLFSFRCTANWISYRNDAKAETSVLWPPHAKSWLTGKDSDAGRDWGQEKGTTEDEMAGWHHQLDGREFEWTPGVGDGQEGLVCWDSWGRKESNTTEGLNWTELNWYIYTPFLDSLPI